jgi:hypothetical protein
VVSAISVSYFLALSTTIHNFWTKPTVGGSEDQWGTITNTIFDEIDTLLGGTSAAEFAILDGITATTSELNFVDGVTSAIQTQIDAKAPIADPTFTGTATIPTAAITTVDFGDWTITEASGVLKFATGGVNKMSLDASGNLTVVGNVNTSGTIA